MNETNMQSHAVAQSEATPPTDPAMRLDAVTFAYHRGDDVIRGLSADVAPGALCMLLGPNGAGKSTLLRLMLGHLRPSAGRVTLDGQPVHRTPARRLAAAVAYVPQRTAVGFAFTARQVIEMARYALSPDPVAIAGAIESCDLAELADRPFVELSVGQQQRVLLARAMAQSAGAGRIVLADEPTAAMDLEHVHRTMRLLRELARDCGRAVLVVAQDINLAARYADRVWLMDRGSLVAAGPWSDVLDASTLSDVYRVPVRAIRRESTTPDTPDPRPWFDVADP